MEPDLLLLDEPLSALDAKLRKSLRMQIKRIQKELGLTTLFVTHDQDEALAMSDEVVLLNKGKIEQHSTPDTLYTQPNNRFTAGFIGHYNIGYFESVKSKSAKQLSMMAIRPETILLDTDDGDIPGVILERTLTGGVVRYQVRTDYGDIFDVDVLNHGKISQLKVNCKVFLIIKDEQVINLDS